MARRILLIRKVTRKTKTILKVKISKRKMIQVYKILQMKMKKKIKIIQIRRILQLKLKELKENIPEQVKQEFYILQAHHMKRKRKKKKKTITC